jgi:formylglycine-generating enzyme required for sulfatase activity
MGVGGEYHDREYIALNGGHAYRNNRCWITYQDGIFIPGAGKENWLVVYVTWYGAKAFAEYFGYDLPTEAEWEYASRAGRGYQYSTLDGTIDTLKANYNFSEGHPVAVGNYPPNSFGLCNMSGNVWEWCNDFYGEYSEKEETNPRGALAGYPHILRGGAWNFSENLCSSSYRYSYWPEYSDNSIGFRVVRR